MPQITSEQALDFIQSIVYNSYYDCSQDGKDAQPHQIDDGKVALRKVGKNINAKHYSTLIQWDPRDDIYIVTVPELPGCRTYGATYQEAINNALEAMKLWVTDAANVAASIPAPATAA